jgi:molecular chaperone DnaK (HSP70)
MSSRKPYAGSERKLILGIDIGTTFSGASFTVADPGVIPVVQGVNRLV